MKGAVVTRYGPPEIVELRDFPELRPRPGEVVMRVHATTVTAADWRMRSGEVPRGFGPLMRVALGWRGPHQAVLGIEATGEVLALGEGVPRFAPGVSFETAGASDDRAPCGATRRRAGVVGLHRARLVSPGRASTFLLFM